MIFPEGEQDLAQGSNPGFWSFKCEVPCKGH